MAGGTLNKVMVIGNLGRDPEVRYTHSGSAVANVAVATSESWRDRQTGEQQERTEWHRLVFFGRLAEVVGEYLRKGSKIYVEGRLQTRKWQDQNNQDRYTTEIVVNEMQMLDGRGNNNGANAGGGNSASGNGQQGGSGDSAAQGASPESNADEPADYDDDIPF